MPCRGLRGATTVAEDTSPAILAATLELLRALVEANDLCPAEIASAFFTVTPDLSATFPAQAARLLGWNSVPLLDAVEVAVPGALPRCIRVLIHWNTDRCQDEIYHVYLRGASALRPDLGRALPLNQRGEELVPIDDISHPAIDSPPAGSSPHPAERAEPGPEEVPGAGEAPVVAYQGEPGAYSQEAIFQHFGPAAGALACHAFEDIFAAVEEGRATYGLLPVENSLAGSVHQAYDLLLEHDLHVVGEVKLRVRHCLLVPPGTGAADIQRVRSHPQALAQTEHYLRRRGWQAVPAYDTAGAARELAASPEPGTAAIASALAGQIYRLEALETGIEDSADNTTRFFVLSRDRDAEIPRPAGSQPAAGARTKTSLVFATAHTPGSLYRALGEFASRGLNLSKIESRPRRNRPWQYVFYLDFEGHYREPAVAQALVALLSLSAFVKLMGSYPAAEEP